MNNQEIHVLCYNRCAKGWNALACWTHKPTKEDIMKLENFKDNTELDNQVANILVEHGLCRINFSDAFKDWFEYYFFQPQENGDLQLSEYLLTGYADFQEDKNIYLKSK